MTYDPHNRRAPTRDGMSGATMAAIAVAAVLGLGALFYAMSDNDQTASTTPSTTTGQRTQSNAPSNPPARAPAPAPQSK
jgi:hypothetical protein